MTTHHDLVVIGGGPTGATVATLAARDGARVVLLERERFPRWQIGESLLPATIHGVCRLLGVTDEIAMAGFVPKRGGTFRWGRAQTPWTFDFATSPRMAGPTASAFQVRRAEFDAILLNNARRHGVEVREECAAMSAVFEDGRVIGVRYRDPDGRTGTVHGRWVIDASGHNSPLQRILPGPRDMDPAFQHLALFTYYEHGSRLPAPNAGNIFCAAFNSGWFWYIPLSDRLTSVGAVVHREHADTLRVGREKAMDALIAECPEIAELLHGAHRATDPPYDQLRVRRDWSYTRDLFWRPGFAVAGDAACFLDPVFSSGVHLGTYAGLLAARSVNAVRAGLTGEADAWSEYQHRYRDEYNRFRNFLVAFYSLHRDPGSYFWAARDACGAVDVSAHEAFLNLVGGISVGDRDATLGRLNGTVDPGALLDSPLTAETMHEGALLQAHAAGHPLPPPTPDRPGGLVPSPDGLRWQPADTAVLTGKAV